MMDFQTIESFKPFKLGPLEIEPVLLPHGSMNTMAFRIGSFAYATDFKFFPQDVLDRWRGKIELFVVSGLHFESHSTHSTIPETMDLCRRLDVPRAYITHLSHRVDPLGDLGRIAPYLFAQDQMVLSMSL
jgi:phosphoribosyl 1,2-cyclic phosphate phosphodiesterase